MNKWTLLSSYLRVKLRQHKLRSREQLEQWQHRSVRRFLTQVVPQSAFYRSLYSGLRVEEWESWPVITKKQFMDHFDELNTVGIRRDDAYELAAKAETTRNFSPMLGDIAVGLSSGTSGHRGVFLVGGAERAAWAGAMLAKLLPDPLYVPQQVAFFLRANNKLYESVRSRLLQFHYFDLLHPVDEHVARLQRVQPTLLAAPPSMLRLLARAAAGGLFRIRPKKIISVAEVLEPLDRQYIGEAFGLPVHQVYQCTEGFIAATCAHGTLHINEDLLAVQPDYIDPGQTRFMPIITDFSRTSQPIIRYRLNDILTMRDEPCPCGSVYRAIGSVEGRMDDLFYGIHVSEHRCVPIFPDFIRRALLLASRHVAEYKVAQLSPREVEVAIVTDGGERSSIMEGVTAGNSGIEHSIEDSIRLQLAEAFAAHRCEPPTVRFVAYKPEQGGVKLRRIRRIFQMEEGAFTV